jgi:quercetin dioxygenase-like cupin family protein
MSERESTTQHEDGRARVNRLTFSAAGDETGIHIHEFDYIVVPVTGGDLTVVAEDGSARELHQVPGVSYTGKAGTHHNVISVSSSPVMFVEIELKSQPRPETVH